MNARTDAAEFVRTWWLARCLLETEDDPVLGPALRSASGLLSMKLRTFGPSAIILPDDAEECGNVPNKDGSGVVFTNVLEVGQLGAVPAPVCTARDLVSNLQRVVDLLQLNKPEADALASMLQGWITRDMREGNRPEDRGIHDNVILP